MVRLLGGDDGSIRRKHEMNARVWHEIRLELSDVNVERTIETKGSGQGRNNLGDKAIQICVSFFFSFLNFFAKMGIVFLLFEKIKNILVFEKQITGALNVEITTTDVIQRFVVDLIGDIGVLQKRMHTQDGVVGFDHRGGHLRAAPDGERDLGFLAVIDGQSFHQQRAKTTSGTTTDGVINLFFVFTIK